MTDPLLDTIQKIPGSYGLPVIGMLSDTLDFFFVSGWQRFFLRRRSRYQSDVFKVNLFRPTIVVLDQKGIEPLFASKQFRQDHGFSWAVPAPQLVGDVIPSIFEFGAAHDLPKQLYMAMLRLRASTLLDVFTATAERFGRKWVDARSFSFQSELESFAVEFLFLWYFGMRPDAAKVRELYLGLFSHVFWRITRFLPWSAYRRSLTTYRQLLDELKGSPGLPELMLVARKLGMHDDEATIKQLLFVSGMNSFLGLQNLCKSVVGELSHRPELCARLRAEIHHAFGDGPPHSMDSLSALRLPLLDKTLREIVRLHPPVSLLFGRATEDRLITIHDGRTFQMRRGELLMGVLPIAMRDHRIFPAPEQFDPSRFDEPAARDSLIWPRGHQDQVVSASDRTCPGKDVSMEIMKLLCIWLLPRYQWQLRDPPVWDERVFGLNVAAPKGSMLVDDFRAVAPAG